MRGHCKWSVTVPLALLALVGWVYSPERWLFRFSVREGTAMTWHILMTTRKIVNTRSQTETVELWVQERVEQVRNNGNLVWASRVIRCVINGEVVPPSELEETVAELTPLGYPVRTVSIPPPTLNRLDEWLLDLFGSVTLVFPASEVSVGDRWHHNIAVGLKPPNEPRRLLVTYRLEGKEKLEERACFRIGVSAQTPLRLLWRSKDASTTVNGGAKLEGIFWFDPQLGTVRQRRVTLDISYALETEHWDGFQFVQRTQFVNQTMEISARLSAP